MTTAPADVAFLFIGGVHQVLHLAPVAAAVSRRRPDLSVHCLCGDAESAAAVEEVRARMNAKRLVVTLVRTPWIAKVAAKVLGRRAAAKGPILAAIRLRLIGARAVVVPERTSAALRWMGWRGLLIHFRHGAGDRAPASEARLAAFDLIVLPGDKDVARAVEARGVDPARLRTCGYVKLDYVGSYGGAAKRPFDDDRPVVLYNPHFDPRLSSIGIARDIVAGFARQERYNLIFAPHVRAVEDLSIAEQDAWRALSVPGRIVVDLGSPKMFDMSHLAAADVYLGDVSSQLYEFLARPRPVAFIDAHHVRWQGDPRYAGWHLGEVADGADTVLDAVDRAGAGHSAKVAAQRAAVAFAFGAYQGAIERGADIVIDAVDARRR